MKMCPYKLFAAALFVKTRLEMTRITSVGNVGGAAPCSCRREKEELCTPLHSACCQGHTVEWKAGVERYPTTGCHLSKILWVYAYILK